MEHTVKRQYIVRVLNSSKCSQKLIFSSNAIMHYLIINVANGRIIIMQYLFVFTNNGPVEFELTVNSNRISIHLFKIIDLDVEKKNLNTMDYHCYLFCFRQLYSKFLSIMYKPIC